MRKIILDTETTGLLFYEGHKIIEIGCIEILNNTITNNIFHKYINPKRKIDPDAKKITGLSDDFLKDKPIFKDIIDDFFNFLSYSDEIIIHNAKFDINFINNELQMINYKIKNIEFNFKIFDTLNFARKIFPGKKNNLDALAERLNVKIEDRTTHGALKDAKILADIYLKLKNIQNNENENENIHQVNIKKISNIENKFKITKSNNLDLKKHLKYIEKLNKNDKNKH